MADLKSRLDEKIRSSSKNYDGYGSVDMQSNAREDYISGASLLAPLLIEACETIKFYSTSCEVHSSTAGKSGIGGQSLTAPIDYDQGQLAVRTLSSLKLFLEGSEDVSTTR